MTDPKTQSRADKALNATRFVVQKAANGFSVKKPDGTWYVFPTIEETLDFVRRELCGAKE